MNNQLVLPMAFYVFIMWFYTVKMFRTRVGAIRSGQVALKFYRAHLGEPQPEEIAVVGRHYDNQFQVPILFFVTCLVHMQVAHTNLLTLALAWFFVFTRIIHSSIMLGRNSIRQRVAAYAVGWITLLALWVQAVYFVIQN